MDLKIISGGQTGADQAGLRAAKDSGLPVGGTAPLGFLTESGPAPWLGEEFGLVEHPSPAYKPRTWANAAQSSATIWFGDADSAGYGCTEAGCLAAGRPAPRRVIAGETTPRMVADWIEENNIQVLNVAGSRASRAPGLGERVYWFLRVVFRILHGRGYRCESHAA